MKKPTPPISLSRLIDGYPPTVTCGELFTAITKFHPDSPVHVEGNALMVRSRDGKWKPLGADEPGDLPTPPDENSGNVVDKLNAEVLHESANEVLDDSVSAFKTARKQGAAEETAFLFGLVTYVRGVRDQIPLIQGMIEHDETRRTG